MNIMIAYLSLVSARNKGLPKEYEWKGEKIVDAVQTNEAAAKFYIRWLAEKEKKEKLDRIIYLCSPEVENNKRIVYFNEDDLKEGSGIYDLIDDEIKEVVLKAKVVAKKNKDKDKSNLIKDDYGFSAVDIENSEDKLKKKYNERKEIKTTEEFFIERIKEYCKKFYNDLYTDNDIDRMFIKIKHNKDVDKDSEVLSNVINEISNLKNNNISDSGKNDITVYIDTTGGLRNYSNMLQLLFKFLTYKNINVDMPIYSEVINDSNKGIFKKVDVYDLLKVLDGVNQFVTTGRSDIIKEALEGESLFNSKNENIIDEMLKATGKFSDSMLLCRTDDLEDILKSINTYLGEFEKQGEEKKYQSNKLVIFNNMIPIIREKFFFAEGEKINYLEMVKWCLDNGLIQQALTIYVEKIPKYITDNKIIVYRGEPSKDGSVEADWLYKEILELQDETAAKVRKVRKEYNLIKKQCLKDKNKILSKDEEENIPAKYVNGNEVINLLYPNNKNKNGKYELHNDTLLGILIKSLRKYYNGKSFDLEKLKENGILSNNKTKEFKSAFNCLNSIINDEPSIRIILNLGEKIDDVILKKTATVKNFSYWTSDNSGDEKVVLGMKDNNFDLERVQKILYDYIYAKAMRNTINHAADKENFTDENKKDYVDDYMGASEMTVENVKNDLERAYNNLIIEG